MHMKPNRWPILLIACIGAAVRQEVASQVPDDLPLPLPAAELGRGDATAPLVPATKDQARRPFLNPDGPDGSSAALGTPSESPAAPDDLAGWVISRPPARENRDACASYWTRVFGSKERWRVVRDARSGGVRAALEGRDESLSPDAEVGVMPPFVLAASDFGGKAMAKDVPLSPEHVLPVEDGWLVAQTRGLPAPVLAWFSRDGARHQALAAEAVRGLSHAGGRLFVLMGGRRPAVRELVRRDGQWTMVEFHTLTEAAMAMTALPEGRLCLATSSRLLALSLDRKVEVLLASPGWSALGPASMLYDAKTNRVYVGLRHFVARCAVEPGHRGVVFLRPGG